MIYPSEQTNACIETVMLLIDYHAGQALTCLSNQKKKESINQLDYITKMALRIAASANKTKFAILAELSAKNKGGEL